MLDNVPVRLRNLAAGPDRAGDTSDRERARAWNQGGDRQDSKTRRSWRTSISRALAKATTDCRCASSKHGTSASISSIRQSSAYTFNRSDLLMAQPVRHRRNQRHGRHVSTRRRNGSARRRGAGQGAAAQGSARLLIGRDTRESGEWIERELAHGARARAPTCTASASRPPRPWRI